MFSAGLGLFFLSVLFGIFSVFFAGLGILSVFCRMFQGCSLQVWGVFFECSVQDVSGCSLQVWGCCLECSLQDVLRCSLQVWGFFGVFLSVLCRIFSVFSAGSGLLSGLFFFFDVLCRVFWDADQCGVSSCRQLHPPRNREPRRDLCPVLSLLRGSPEAGPPLSLSATNPQPGGHEEPQTLHPALHSQILGPF